MTLNELKGKIAEMPNSDWFIAVQANFNFQYINYSQTITGLSAIYEFVLLQIEGWEKIGDNTPNDFKNSKPYFEGIKTQIIQLLSHQNQTVNVWNAQWNMVSQKIAFLNYRPFLYDIPETTFLIRVFKDTPKYYQGAYCYITGTISQNNQLQDKNYFTGVLLAYEFTLKDKSQITERRNAEETSLKDIKQDFQSYITESEKQLSEHLKNANENYKIYVNAIDKLKGDKEKLFVDWFGKTTVDFNTFNDDSTKKIKDLERTYAELLSLKEPAKYWNLRAEKLNKQGWIAVGLVVVLVLIICTSLYFLLWKTPEGMLKTFFSDDKSQAVRWSIVFITFISFMAFVLRALIKVTFSSFHLARDAEERESLMYVYLSMVKDATIAKEDRQMIMQSLFSRADTGLLKDDSAPTMPGIGSFIERQ